MRYREKLSIIIMRDNGPRRNFSIRRSNFFLLLIFFACLPFLCLLLTTQCWLLWQDNIKLRDSMERSEIDFLALENRAERLENLEELLKVENVQAHQILSRQLASGARDNSLPTPEKASEEQPPENGENTEAEASEGPGHEEFPALDTGRVKVSNAQARAIRGNTLRIGVDLRNPDNEPLLSGEIEATLLTDNGERRPLVFAPAEASAFRISRFKRAVLNASLPRNLNLTNSQIILEVRDQAGKPIYRNLFAVQH